MNGKRLSYLPFRSLQRHSDNGGLRASLLASRQAKPWIHAWTQQRTRTGDTPTNWYTRALTLPAPSAAVPACRASQHKLNRTLGRRALIVPIGLRAWLAISCSIATADVKIERGRACRECFSEKPGCRIEGLADTGSWRCERRVMICLLLAMPECVCVCISFTHASRGLLGKLFILSVTVF